MVDDRRVLLFGGNLDVQQGASGDAYILDMENMVWSMLKQNCVCCVCCLKLATETLTAWIAVFILTNLRTIQVGKGITVSA